MPTKKRELIRSAEPWFAEPDGDDDWKVVSVEGHTVVHRNCYPEPRCDPFVEGDARLIAAAPDLLAACEYALASLVACRRDVRSDGTPGEPAQRLMSAIAKATGQGGGA